MKKRKYIKDRKKSNLRYVSRGGVLAVASGSDNEKDIKDRRKSYLRYVSRGGVLAVASEWDNEKEKNI